MSEIVYCENCGKINGGPNCRCDDFVAFARGLGNFVYGKPDRRADLSIEGNYTRIRVSEAVKQEKGRVVQFAEGCGEGVNPLDALANAKKAFDTNYAKHALKTTTLAQAFRIIAKHQGRVTISPAGEGFAVRIDFPEMTTFSKTPVDADKILDHLKSVIADNGLFEA